MQRSARPVRIASCPSRRAALAPAALVAALLLTSAAPAAALPAADLSVGRPGHDGRGYVPRVRVPGRALLQLRAGKLGATGPALDAIAKRTGVDVQVVRPIALGWLLLEVRDAAAPGALPTEEQTLALVDRLAADAAVAAAADDKWYRALRVPSDPLFDDQWALAALGAPAAWDLTIGTATQRVGVVDTGLVVDHEDLVGRAVAGYDFVSQGGLDGDGRDADYDDSGDACAQQGQTQNSYHGTHVAGTIGARADNDEGVAGLSWNAGLVIARSLGACGGDVVDIMEGALWLAGANIAGAPSIGADRVSVMNLSLGSASGCSSYEQQVIDYINGQGAIFVAAAGNDGGAVGSPANCTGVISVAAHGPGGALTGYSSFGAQIEIVAPGGDTSTGQSDGILSTLGPTSSSYAYYEGTSMAAPHVAGAVSLMQALDPGLTRAEIVALLQDNGAACGGCGTVPRMDLAATLQAITPTDATPPDPVDDPPAADDPFEENDTFDRAHPVVCGDQLELIAADGDLDWFLVSVPADQQLTVQIHAHDGDDLDLYAATGAVIPDDFVAVSESPTGDETIAPAVGGVALGVLVAPYANPNTGVRAEGPYTLSVVCAPIAGPTGPGEPTEPSDPSDPADPTDPVDPADPSDPSDPSDPTDPSVPSDPAPTGDDDAMEPNDAPDAAVELFCGQEQELFAADDDWFVVYVRALDDLTITARGDAPVDVRVLADGTPIAAGRDRAQAALLAEGAYLVHVAPVEGAGAYALAIECAQNPAGAGAAGGCASLQGGGAVSLLALLGLLARRRCAAARK